MSAQPDYTLEDSPDFGGALQADAQTLATRGFASNFCAAWLAFWPYVTARYGSELENAFRATFPRKAPKTAAQIVASVSRSTMALMSAAVRADKSKSERRRFHCSAWALESYRAGLELVPDRLPALESKRQRQNLSRYWRDRWRLLHLFQNVTQLPLFLRSSRDWKSNRESHEAAAYTDQATDLFLEIAGRGGRRPKQGARRLSRVLRFEQATAEAVENFRRRVGQYAPGYVIPAPATPATKSEAEPKTARVISFAKAKERLLAGVEAVKARADAGALTPAERDEIVLLLAPLVGLAAGSESSKGDGVPSEDVTAESAGHSGPAGCDFSGKFEESAGATADKFIRPETVHRAPLSVSPAEFLAAFYPDPREPVRLRFFGPKDVPRDEKGFPLDSQFNALKDCATRASFDASPGLLRKLQRYNATRGVYFVVNAGGDKAGEITRVNAFFAEIDDKPLSKQHSALDACPLPPSIRNETKKSVHSFWPAGPGTTLEEFDEIQRRLIHYFKSDPKIKDRSRVMRLPGFNHISYRDGLLDVKQVECVAFDPSRKFTAAEMLVAFPPVPEPPRPRNDFRPRRVDNLEDHKRELGARIMAHPTARRNGSGKWDCRGVCHNGKGATGLFYDPRENFVWCNAQTPCDLVAISQAFGLEMPVGTPTPFKGDGRERGTL